MAALTYCLSQLWIEVILNLFTFTSFDQVEIDGDKYDMELGKSLSRSTNKFMYHLVGYLLLYFACPSRL
jgi:hypothetical protein